MKKSKTIRSFSVVELLENFSEKEVDSLRRFASCTYFNTDRYVVKLLDVLLKKIINKRQLSSELQYVVYKQVFSDQPLQTETLKEQQIVTFRVKMSALNRLCEQFITIEALEEDEAYKAELLHRKLFGKKQFRLLKRSINKSRKQLSPVVKGIDHYHHKYKLETDYLDYLYRSGEWVKEDNLKELNESVDIYFLLKKLSLHITALSFMDVSAQKSYDFSAFEIIKNLSDLPQYATHPLVQINLVMIGLINQKTHKDYVRLLDLLDQHEVVIPVSNLKDYYNVASNFCVYKITTGDANYFRYQFELYQIMEQKSLLLEHALIPPIKLKNIVSVSCRVGEFDYAVGMIEKYTASIRKDIRNSIRDFNLGAIEFYKKDYEKAIDYLYKIENIDLPHDMNRRIMMIKSYYEMDTEYKETTAQVFRSAEKYIHENKLLTTKNRKAYKNFIRLLINLYRIRHTQGKVTLERARKKLEEQVFNSDKRWLLEKIDELAGCRSSLLSL